MKALTVIALLLFPFAAVAAPPDPSTVDEEFMEAEGDVLLLKENKRAPYSGVLITYTDLVTLWTDLQQATYDYDARGEHILVLEGTIAELQLTHQTTIQQLQEAHTEQLAGLIRGLPDPVVFECPTIAWYESVEFWTPIAAIAGVFLGAGVVYLFSD